MCLSVKDKVAETNAKMQVWDCENDVGKTFTKKWTTKSGAFNLEYQDSGYCVVGKTKKKGMKSGTQLYLWECKKNDPTQQWAFDGGRHLYYQEIPELCMTATGTSKGDEVVAKTCSWSLSTNDYQKWAFAS